MSAIAFRQVHPEVPAWDIFDGDVRLGLMSNLPAEGRWMATIRHAHTEMSVHAESRDALALDIDAAYAFLSGFDGQEYHEDHIEDEDGSIAFAAMLERRAEHDAGDWLEDWA